MSDPFGPALNEKLASQKEGEVVLLENLRRDPREKTNDESFGKELASLADLYVNEAFPVSHRPHASVVGIPKFLPSFAGLRFAQEVKYLSAAFNPPKPFLFILGGAKFETKLPLIKKFITVADYVYVGGALANDLFKAKSLPVGDSKVSGAVDLSEIVESKKIILPSDVIVQNGNDIAEKLPTEVGAGDKIFDAGPKSVNDLRLLLQKSAFVLWNGPLGNFELGFKEATIELAKLISESDTTSLIGGADTIAAISELHLEEKFGFISTGGGAMLDFLASGTLPGITALENSNSVA